ncbi:MAG: hypothetical protein JJU36_13380 [Phycisphaeraceae bacterium]|nr:hypothetical protein [Phycisphaeraceae bacterium]
MARTDNHEKRDSAKPRIEKPRKAMRLLRLAAIFILLALGAMTVLTSGLGGGSSLLEKFIGGQLKAISAAYLNPKLEFDALALPSASSVMLINARLVDIDPVTLERHVAFEAERLLIELGEVPRVGRPLLIRKIVLDRATVSLIERPVAGGGFYGFTNLIRADEPDDPRPRTEDDVSIRLSDIFEIRLIQLVDASVRYRPAAPDAPELVLPAINASLNLTEPRGGWYRSQVRIDRAPVTALEIDGRFHLDDLLVELARLSMDVGLDESGIATLPPDVQRLIHRHEAGGKLSVEGAGRIDLKDPSGSSLRMRIRAREVRLAGGGLVAPVESLELDLGLDGGRLEIGRFGARVGEGRIGIPKNGRIVMALNPGGSSIAGVELDRVQLARFSRERTTTDEQATTDQGGQMTAGEDALGFAGMLSGVIEVQWDGPGLASHTRGKGWLEVKEGSLARLPGLAHAVEAVREGLKLVGVGSGNPGDEARLDFDFAGDHLRFSRIHIRGSGFAADGSGTLGYDGRVDVTFNGGPIRAIGRQIPLLGDLTALVTDQLSRFRLVGPLDDPEFRMEFAGGLIRP